MKWFGTRISEAGSVWRRPGCAQFSSWLLRYNRGARTRARRRLSSDVGSVIIEKPIAVPAEDYRGLLEFSRRRGLEVAVDHRLHSHPLRQALQCLVADGHIGEVHFAEVSIRSGSSKRWLR